MNMAGTIVAENNQHQSATATEPTKAVGVLGVPLAYGASMAGVDIGPAALRVARLNRRIAQLGYEVRDLGDLRLERPQSLPEPNDKLKYLHEVRVACEQLAIDVREIMTAGELPLVLGGDHSIAIGSIAGVCSYCRERNDRLG